MGLNVIGVEKYHEGSNIRVGKYKQDQVSLGGKVSTEVEYQGRQV